MLIKVFVGLPNEDVSGFTGVNFELLANADCWESGMRRTIRGPGDEVTMSGYNWTSITGGG